MLKRIYNIFEPYFGGMDFYVHVLFRYLLLIYDKIAQAMRLFLCIKKKKIKVYDHFELTQLTKDGWVSF